MDLSRLNASMAQRLYSRSAVTGEITLPAVPGMIDEYVKRSAALFAAVGREFSDEELAQFRAVLESQLAEAYAASSRSSIVLSYNAAIGTDLNYLVAPRWSTVEGAYEDWISTREPPLFGSQPDARVWAIASEAADPTIHPVLDIGAGTGRNALALARRGHPVDAVEMTPKFADIIRSDADRELLRVRVVERDVFTTMDDLRRDYRLILLSEVVSDFRSTEQLRGLFELATQCLVPSGCLVFNAFVARDGYAPDDAARELGQQMATSIFTEDEIIGAVAQLPLQFAGYDSVYEYEKTHLPDGGWPPTSWYANWVSGLDVFGGTREESPVEMRWLVLQKT